jgi:hypothetical protein
VDIFDIHMSVHHNIIPNYSQQDAMFLDLFISKDAVHVSGSSSAHHQEYTTVPTASDIVSQYYCQLLLIHGSSQQQYWLTIPETVCTVLCS